MDMKVEIEHGASCSHCNRERDVEITTKCKQLSLCTGCLCKLFGEMHNAIVQLTRPSR